ncbi:hypothetical protein DWV34_00335 [Anaerostipes sp. AF04-45]|uniref:Uncharacterized protein n=1 Tax=Anaerostipes caccae (strain DSM 14662 / CCUG 47493 / JCM 13470 / NCIMB 13811 / L1-92) TaxID=411490 RepID=B0MIK4_ANACD|nr:hypothetical protein ANACAC_03459 [Anaerostipes caccae L1-92]RGH25675.1 hypothetical protein DWV34_00335 [Anaerostipes sp. AF04-45]
MKKEKGDDGNGYIPSFKPFIFRRYVPDRMLTYIDRNKKRKIKVGLPALRATYNLPKANCILMHLCAFRKVFFIYREDF